MKLASRPRSPAARRRIGKRTGEHTGEHTGLGGWSLRRLLRVGLVLGLGALIGIVAAVTTAAVLQPSVGKFLGRAFAGFASKHSATWAFWDATSERLVLDIDFTSLQKIAFDRERALRDRINDSDDNLWAKGSIRQGEQSIPIKLRLKGAHSDHWRDADKTSLLIKVRGEGTYKRMKRFSIQSPRTRSYLFEWLFMQVLRDEGMIALRTDFVEVVINGENRGLFTLQEQAGKRLIENNGRREGAIIGFDKSPWLHFPSRDRRLIGTFESARIKSSQSGGIAPGSHEETMVLKASSLLEAFRRRELSASQVLDVDQTARLMALYALFQAMEFDWKDLKFYYNPITSRLVPIGREVLHKSELAVPGWWLGDEPLHYKRYFMDLFFDDEELMDAYVASLHRFSRADYVDSLLERHASALASHRRALEREFPSHVLLDPAKELRRAQGRIRTYLRPPTAALANYVSVEQDQLVLELAAVHHFALDIVHVEDSEGHVFTPVAPTRLTGKKTEALVRYSTAHFQIPAGLEWLEERGQQLTLHFRVRGLDEIRTAQVARWPHRVKTYAQAIGLDAGGGLPSSSSIPDNVAYLVRDEATGALRCRPGEWEIRRPLVIPRGSMLFCDGGVRWDLLDGAFILSHSAIVLSGSETRPIVIESSDGTGQGLAVLSAEGESLLKHVSFRGLSAPAEAGWSLSGAITFYESRVRIESCHFAENRRGDDMLNIFQSSFEIRDSVFEDTVLDALDLDFSSGELANLLFRNIGNDAIDTSGSEVRLRQIRIDGAADKGMSFGEASSAWVEDSQIRGARIGLSSKDLSRVELTRVSIEESEIAGAAYQKKPEFGPATIQAISVELARNETDWMIERGSTLIRGRKRIAGKIEDVKSVLYGAK